MVVVYKQGGKTMRNVKWIAVLLLILQLALPINLQANAATDVTLNYTALGDSLAAGMDDQGKIGPGYADRCISQGSSSG